MGTVVLAISGSLRNKSFTEKMLDLCIEGMGENLEVHKFYPHKMKIGPCTSCWSCWGKKRPGECIQEDDFQRILDVYKRADYFLLAAPLYFCITTLNFKGGPDAGAEIMAIAMKAMNL